MAHLCHYDIQNSERAPIHKTEVVVETKSMVSLGTMSSSCIAATHSVSRVVPVRREGLRREERAKRRPSKESQMVTGLKKGWSEVGCGRQVSTSDFDEALGSVLIPRRGRRGAMGIVLSVTFAQFLFGDGPTASADEVREDNGATSVGVENFQTTTEEPTDWYGFEDLYDDYFVLVPPEWTQVTTAGADIFYRNTTNVGQNLFVTLSSKSSSKYKSLSQDFGTPQEAGEILLRKYMGEFMSTRIGINRAGKVLAAAERTNADDQGRQFYDFLINIDSYAARNQYGITSGERVQTKEWDRYFLTTIGIQGERLFELRLQCNKEDYEKDREKLLHILHSFELSRKVM